MEQAREQASVKVLFDWFEKHRNKLFPGLTPNAQYASIDNLLGISGYVTALAFADFRAGRSVAECDIVSLARFSGFIEVYDSPEAPRGKSMDWWHDFLKTKTVWIVNGNSTSKTLAQLLETKAGIECVRCSLKL